MQGAGDRGLQVHCTCPTGSVHGGGAETPWRRRPATPGGRRGPPGQGDGAAASQEAAVEVRATGPAEVLLLDLA